MTQDHHRQVLELFSSTFELAARERRRVLDRECPDDPDLRRDVERMLQRHDGLGCFLDVPALGMPLPEHAGEEEGLLPDLVGQRLGDCTLTRVLARGGMGVVYEALQASPRRTVAVKVLSRGLTSRSAERRFQYEAEILARLRHPFIAQIFEAGTWEGPPGAALSLPYFVMEYIPDARSITRYAQEEDLDAGQRLDLFRRVCQAVQYGHQRGVIHRDLKPDNILVDDQGTPKVIDFGVARMISPELDMTTMRTLAGQIVGTLQYMSPEQCDAEPHELDTRSDVYSLGMILHELITGQPPYDVSRLAVHHALEVIRNQDPPPDRGTSRHLRGDLGTITRKALEKEPDRRYATVRDLDLDLGRFLGHEPIAARPPSALYQAGRFMRRKRALVAGAAAVFLALILGLVGTTWQARKTHRSREFEERARKDAEAESAVKTAHYEFLHQLLTGFEPGESDMTVERLVDRAAARVEGAYPDQPLVEADVHDMLRHMYGLLGRREKALPHARRSLELREGVEGPAAEATLRSMMDLGQVQEDLATGENWLERTWRTAALALGEDHPLTLEAAGNLAMNRWKQGRAQEAGPLLRSVLEAVQAQGDPGGSRSMLLSNLGLIEEDLGHREEAIRLFREAIAITRQAADPAPARLGLQLVNLGAALRRAGHLEDARESLEEAAGLQRDYYGPNHPETFRALDQLAWLHEAAGRFADAARVQEALLAGQRSYHQTPCTAIAETLHHLADDWQKAGRRDVAEQLGAESLELFHRLDEFPARELRHAAEVQYAILDVPGRSEDRLTMLSEAIADLEKTAGSLHPELIPLLRLLAAEYLSLKDPEAALGALEQCVEITAEHPDSPWARGTGQTVLQGTLGQGCALMDRLEEAERHFLDAMKLVESEPEAADTFQSLGRGLIQVYERWGRPEDAQAVLDRLVHR